MKGPDQGDFIRMRTRQMGKLETNPIKDEMNFVPSILVMPLSDSTYLTANVADRAKYEYYPDQYKDETSAVHPHNRLSVKK